MRDGERHDGIRLGGYADGCGVPRKVIAGHAGMSEATLCRIFNGTQRPDIMQAVKIGQAIEKHRSLAGSKR